jgi:predicted acylesterase/phospholipase RssA
MPYSVRPPSHEPPGAPGGPGADTALARLRAARRVGFMFSGGSMRCAFQVGAVEVLRELGIRPALCVGISGGAWNAAAVAAGCDRRLRHYWRAFVRMPPIDLRNLVREHSPFIYAELHRRTFSRYVGVERLRSAGTPPLWIGVTRLRDRRQVLFDARRCDDPLALLLASNWLPPFFTHAPRFAGERYGDGGASDNLPYEKAFAEGCDAVVILTMKGESEGGLYRGPRDADHAIPPPYRERAVVIRPRHRLPISFVERRWPAVLQTIELGHLRAREVLLGESHPGTEARAEGRAPTALLAGLLRAGWRAPDSSS